MWTTLGSDRDNKSAIPALVPTHDIAWQIAKQTDEFMVEFWRELNVVFALRPVAPRRYWNARISVDLERRRTN
jgi:hypothetical protein